MNRDLKDLSDFALDRETTGMEWKANHLKIFHSFAIDRSPPLHFTKSNNLQIGYCLRLKAKDLGITRVVVLVVGFLV